MRKAPRQPDFSAVYEEHVWTVYGFFGYRVRSRDDAEDLTQLTFERALRAWGSYDERKASVRTWLMAIARNILVDHYRSDRSALQQPLDELAPGAEPVHEDFPGEVSDLSVDLSTALGELGEREREIVALRYGGDMSGPEIAEMTGLSLANVQQISSRALRKLRERLAPHRPDPSA